MKALLPLITSLLIIYSCNNKSSDTKENTGRESLKKLSWIEGNWKGMDDTTAFYEVYQLDNDSTLRITSYSWNGTDSSGSSFTPLHYEKGDYYFGNNLNWKVTSITDSSIFMEPVFKATNTILWKKRNVNSWIATLESKQYGRREYLMERVNYFDAKNK